MRLAVVMITIVGAAFQAFCVHAAENPLLRLQDANAEIEAEATKEIVAAGEKFFPEIQAAHEKARGNKVLQRRYRYVIGRVREVQMRKWLQGIAPDAEKRFPWKEFVRVLEWQARPATGEDARYALALVAREVDPWEERAAVKVLGALLKDESVKVRQMAVGSLDREEWKNDALDLLLKATRDKAEIVRVEAGARLVVRGDRRGVIPATSGAISKDPHVRTLSLEQVQKLIAVEPGQPQHARFKHTKEDVLGLIPLLAIEDWVVRGHLIRLFGMIGDKSAAAPLLAQLPKEKQAKNMNRIFGALAQFRHRPAAKIIPTYFGKGLKPVKRDYNWRAAHSWAEIGDPETVPQMIALLDRPEVEPYAVAALGWAFQAEDVLGAPHLRSSPGRVVVPTQQGTFKVLRESEAPSGGELKKLWETFWAKHKHKYAWSDEKQTLRDVKAGAP